MSTKTICPGQDTRFWHPEDIFDSRCANCGSIIEFFKDEASQKCKKCGTRVQNPRLNMGCAQWCEHAKDCLGYDPKTESADSSGAENVGYDMSLADKIIDSVKMKFGEKSEQYKKIRTVHERVEKILSEKFGRPRIVIPASLLLTAGGNKIETIELSKDILKNAGMDNAALSDVIEIIEKFHNGERLNSDEFEIVVESNRLTEPVNIQHSF